MSAAGLKAVYLDLDGTLLGSGASLLRDGDGAFTLLGARALEACARAGAEVVLYSGRRRSLLEEDGRVLGVRDYVFEVGSGLMLDGEVEWLTGDLEPRDGRSVRDRIVASGAPGLLLEAFPGLRLDRDQDDREVTVVFRGEIDTAAADALLAERGHGGLRLLHNGPAKHLLPRGISKGRGVARHMRARGLAPEEVIAVGDSREDLGVAEAVGVFWLVANGLAHDHTLREEQARLPNVRVTEAGHGPGVYEAVLTTLAGG